MESGMSILKAGIIGQGRSGYGIHASAIAELADKYIIAAVSDPIAERRERAAAQFDCDAYKDYRSLFMRNDLDFVVNTLPSHLHSPVSLELLDAGFNVVCEKPVARYTQEMDTLIKKAEEKQKVLTVYQQHRFSPAFLKIKELIESGILGRAVMVKIAANNFSRRWDWQTLKEYYGGNLLNTGPHFLDQALQLMGTDIMPEIKCCMDSVNASGDAEDHVKLIMSSPGRPTIDLEISSCSAYPQNMYQVYGSNGGLTGDLTRLEWRYFKPEEAPEQPVVMDTSQIGADNLKWYEAQWGLPKEQADLWPYMAKCYYQNLYNAFTGSAPFEVSLDEMRQQVAVLEECHRQNNL